MKIRTVFADLTAIAAITNSIFSDYILENYIDSVGHFPLILCVREPNGNPKTTTSGVEIFHKR